LGKKGRHFGEVDAVEGTPGKFPDYMAPGIILRDSKVPPGRIAVFVGERDWGGGHNILRRRFWKGAYLWVIRKELTNNLRQGEGGLETFRSRGRSLGGEVGESGEAGDLVERCRRADPSQKWSRKETSPGGGGLHRRDP